MERTISPFLLAKAANESILRDAANKLNFLSQKKIILNDPTSLMNYVGQIRNFSAYTHMVIDITAIEERNEDFIEALKGIQYQLDDMVFVIYAVELQAGDEFLDMLVNSGFTNIVADPGVKDETEKWEQIKQDILDCFSENGLPEKSWKRYCIEREQPLPQLAGEEKIEIPDFSKEHKKICVYGASENAGATTAVLTIASYFSAGNADVRVVMRSKDQLEALKKFCGVNTASETFNYSDNVVFAYDFQEENDAFNITVCDVGLAAENPIQEDAMNIIVFDTGFDKIVESMSSIEMIRMMESTPVKLIADLCTKEHWKKLINCGMVNKEIEPLLLPFVNDKLTFEQTAENIKAFNAFFMKKENENGT